MKLSTGKTAFTMEFDNGDKGIIYFNPNDRGIQERIKEFEKSVSEKVNKIDLEKYSSKLGDGFSFDVNSIFDLSVEELEKINEKVQVLNDIEKEYNSAVKSELDKVFNAKVSDVAFRYCEPFDTVIVEENGEEKRELYILHFLKWLGVELGKYAKKNNEAMDKHIAKYVKK